jgi:hypothetical protein
MPFANVGFQLVNRSKRLVTSTKHSHFSNHPNGFPQASLGKTANFFGLGSLILEGIEKGFFAFNETKNFRSGAWEGLRGYMDMSMVTKYRSEDRPAPYNACIFSDK